MNQKEPLFQISKRDAVPFWKACLVRLIAVGLSLCVCALVIFCLTRLNPIAVYQAVIKGAVGTARRTWITVRDAMVLLCISLAITPAFKMRFWNIGAEGQVLMGGAATAAVMIYCTNQVPVPVLFAMMVIGSMVTGCLWGMLPAICKAKWGTNETLFTLMFNYIAMQFLSFCIVHWENPAGSNSVGIINKTSKIGWFSKLFGLDYGWNILIVLVLTVLMYIYLNYSKQGYEISVVGESENTARYAGINPKKVIIRTMALSGSLCGLAGFLLVSGSSHTISTNTAGGRGFTAIIVSWLAHFNPFFMLLLSLFLVFLEKGSIQIASQFRLNASASEVLTGIILFFILGSEFFLNYQVKIHHRTKEED